MRWKALRVPSLLVRRDRTRVVIEAFPRSSNSFAVRLFQQANPTIEYDEIAHHAHIISNVKQAARWDIPALIIVRNPVDAIASNMLAYRDTSDEMLSILCRKYLDFYEWVSEHSNEVVLVRFEDITEGRFRTASANLNERFGTSFNTDFDESEIARRAGETIREKSPNRDDPSRIPIPTEERARQYDELIPRIRRSPQMRSCLTLYDDLVANLLEACSADHSPSGADTK